MPKGKKSEELPFHCQLTMHGSFSIIKRKGKKGWREWTHELKDDNGNGLRRSHSLVSEKICTL